ncbi:uncharacterized protein RJT21DRAFT_120075 [Scheffersomyces amazonensis]|uniref:uncharacterized protein n=1 Tax=Scheffersomyces amazonensis TaxID=1078765 RepID=UPI00315CEBD0
MDRLKDDTINKYMFYCLPKVLEEMLGKCIMQLSQALTLDHAINSINIDNIHSSKDYISYLIQNFLGPLYRKLTKLNFDALLPLSEDMNNIYFDILNNHSMKSKKNFSQTYLSGIIFYKNMINSKEISNQDWELIQFIYDFTCTFHEIICCCEANENPNIHMLSKWLKILIIHISTFSKSRAMLLNIKIDSYLLELLNEIKQLHDSIQENFNLIVASYLHPSTKRYLNDQQVGRINSYVGKLSSKNSNQKESTAASLSIDNMEDMIMQLFDCSGKATKECYNYETSSTSEIKYNKNATYISRENGPHLLHFWERNQYKYSTLSDLASQSLGIQLSTNLKSIESFKNAYGGLKNEDCYPIHFLQQFYVLHGLSKCYDLQSFDPKQSDGDIDNFRIEPPDYIDMDLDSSFEIDFKQYQAKRSKK